MNASGCVFCEIVAGRSPASMVYEDDTVVAFMDIRPVIAGHLLVVSRAHAQLVTELDAPTWQAMTSAGRRLDAAMRQVPELHCEAVALYVADGAAAGQEIPHAHLHVIPRYRGDGFGFHFPPGYGEFIERDRLDRTASAVRAALEP